MTITIVGYHYFIGKYSDCCKNIIILFNSTKLQNFCELILMVYSLVVSVNAQQGSCRASVNCDGSPGDVLISVTTIENCCLNTAGLAFNVRESCTPCIGMFCG